MKKYSGIDLHSNNSVVVVSDEADRMVYRARLPNELGKVLEALEPYRDELVGVVVESTYNWYWLVDALMEEGYRVHLANPAAMKQYEGIKYLSDRHDAFWLANMLKLGILPEGYIYPRQTRGIRDLLRQRSRFVVQRTSLKHTLQQVYCNYTGAKLNNNAIHQMQVDEIRSTLPEDSALCDQVQSLLSVIRFLEERIKAIETRVLSQVEAGPIYPLLTSVVGIGKVLGMTITLENGPIDRFACAGQFASYCRCVPSSYWSNEKQKGVGNKKNGNKYLSWAFAEAANFSIRYCSEAKAFYQRKCAKTNQPKAYRAVANKLAKACYYVMRDHVVFDAKRLFCQ